MDLLAEFSSSTLIRDVCQSSLFSLPPFLFPFFSLVERVFSYPHYIFDELKGDEKLTLEQLEHRPRGYEMFVRSRGRRYCSITKENKRN